MPACGSTLLCILKETQCAPLYLVFSCVGGSNEHSLSLCLAKKCDASFLRRALCLSAMLVSSSFSGLFSSTKMCECPSQLPRTQPVHITAKRHKLGSQGMREVQIAFRLNFLMQCTVDLLLLKHYGLDWSRQWQLPLSLALCCALSLSSAPVLSGFGKMRLTQLLYMH